MCLANGAFDDLCGHAQLPSSTDDMRNSVVGNSAMLVCSAVQCWSGA